MTLDDYDDLLAFADLRGGSGYTTHLGPDDEREVCAIVLARYGPSSGPADATLLIELDRRGLVIDDSLYLAPREAMESWPTVSWEPLPGVDDVTAFVRERMTR